MTAMPVEWVLVVYYGPSAHRATYGRLAGTHYTKDYIQLSRKTAFTEAIANLFASNGVGEVPLTYRWPLGSAIGQLIFRSADRPHLAWETKDGAPDAWRMSMYPSDTTAETIPGDPSHQEFEMAEQELELLGERGAGQPYLVAVKLHGEPRTLHLRAYLSDPDPSFDWANLDLVPKDIQDLAKSTSRGSALGWLAVSSGGTLPSEAVRLALDGVPTNRDAEGLFAEVGDDVGRSLADYLTNPAHGLFFDSSKNHDAWFNPPALPELLTPIVDELAASLRLRFPTSPESDAAAEVMEVSAGEVAAFADQIEDENFSVPDTHATTKTRGSAQRAFSQKVRANYSGRCAITGIESGDFLVAAHIVPWSVDQSIRLDPCNGICLSSLMDRAFEIGYVLIDDDLTVRVNWEKVGADASLRKYLEAYDGAKLGAPKQGAPKVDYLKRRRELMS